MPMRPPVDLELWKKLVDFCSQWEDCIDVQEAVAGGWPPSHARWVVSCSPTPCYFHGNALFVSVYYWAGRPALLAFMVFLSRSQPHLFYVIRGFFFILSASLFLSISYIGPTHTNPQISSADSMTLSVTLLCFPLCLALLPLFSWTSDLLY